MRVTLECLAALSARYGNGPEMSGVRAGLEGAKSNLDKAIFAAQAATRRTTECEARERKLEVELHAEQAQLAGAAICWPSDTSQQNARKDLVTAHKTIERVEAESHRAIEQLRASSHQEIEQLKAANVRPTRRSGADDI